MLEGAKCSNLIYNSEIRRENGRKKREGSRINGDAEQRVKREQLVLKPPREDEERAEGRDGRHDGPAELALNLAFSEHAEHRIVKNNVKQITHDDGDF